MRCPECDQRNSVAARKCKFCGSKIGKKNKPAPLNRKFIVAGALSLVIGGVGIGLLLPKLADPGETLASCAKRVAAGPKSAEDAKRIKADLDKALETFLLKAGDEPSTKLASRLQNVLPSQAFEVHVVDLPKGLKLVEIDTLLQASDFLVMKGTTETKVFALPNFEVFDDAKLVNDQAGPVLVLLGHSSGQMPHRPHLRTYAILPDFIVDETDKMVPILKGEGTAKFLANSADLSVELSLASMAREERVSFSSPLPPDLMIRQRLKWKDAKYVPEYESSPNANAYLFMLGRCLANPNMLSVCGSILGPAANKLVKERAGDGLGEVSIAAFSAKGHPGFALRGKNKQFQICLGRSGAGWDVAKCAVSEMDQNVSPVIASGVPGAQTAPVRSANTPTSPDAAVAAVAGPSSAPAIAPAHSPLSTAPGTAPDTVARNVAPLTAPEFSPTTGTAVAPVAAVQEHAKKQNLETEKNKDRGETAEAGQRAFITDNLSSGNIRLRSKPTVHGATLADLSKGSRITVLSKENGWYKVSYNGETGYVYGPYVDFKKPTQIASASAGSYTTAVVTRPWTVRDEHHRSLAHPRKGDRLVILSGINKNNKYKVQLADGRVGYMDKSAVDVKLDTPEFVP